MFDWTNTREKIITSPSLEFGANALFPHSPVYIWESQPEVHSFLCDLRCVFDLPVCTAVLITVFSPLQRNMWRVTLAAPQRPSCRRTLASISCSVKRATPAALSPASRPASRLWRARGRSSVPKPTKDHRNWALPPLSASRFPPLKGRSWGWTPPWFAKRTLWIELREGLAVV